MLLTVHFPFLNLDRSFFGFFLDEAVVWVSPSSFPLAGGFCESTSSSPEAEDDEEVVDALEEAGAGVVARFVLLALVAVDVALAINC